MVISKKLQSNFETGCFTVNLLHFFKTSVSINTSGGLLLQPIFPANIYLFKFNNRNIRKRCEIYSKLTIKHQNNVNDIALVFLLLTLKYFKSFSYVSIVDFKQVNFSLEPVYTTAVDYSCSVHSLQNSFFRKCLPMITFAYLYHLI